MEARRVKVSGLLDVLDWGDMMNGLVASSDAVYSAYDRMLATLEHMVEETGVELDCYFVPNRQQGSPSVAISAKDMLRQMAFSLQNSGRMHNSIAFDEGDDCFESTLCGFDPVKIVGRYMTTDDKDASAGALLDELYHLGVANRRTEPGWEVSNWGKYVWGVLDAAQLFSDEGFVDRVNQAIKDQRLEWAKEPMEDLPALLEREVKGLGPALSRDFLKECGCTWCAKPDGHIMRVVRAAGWCARDADEVEVARCIFDAARVVRLHGTDEQATAYKLDKMIWLLCTGDFYRKGDPGGGHEGILVAQMQSGA